MSDDPWLTIVGIGEDGLDGLTPASRKALCKAQVIIGPERHLKLAGDSDAERVVWPVPFADGIEKLLALRGRRVVMLASGNPFWYGSGSVVAKHIAPGEWRALPSPSVFSLAAARLGWPLEGTTCLGLHAAPFARLRPHLMPGARAIVTVRDGKAVADLARWLVDEEFGSTHIHVMEAIGGPRERMREATAAALDFTDIDHPVAVGLVFDGPGEVAPLTSGLPDSLFDHDGQITKRPVRAITLSTLAPRPGEQLWDIGAGSGSIGIEWLLAHASCTATAIEANPARAARVRSNAARLGADRLRVIEGRAPQALAGLETPDAVFIGGGLGDALLDTLWQTLPPGCRVVANAVTLESEALLAEWQARAGGSLIKIDLSEAVPIGPKRGWQAAYPIVQWSATR